MASIFTSEAARAKMLAWYERFRARIPAPTEARTLKTRAGETHLLVGGPASAPPLVLFHGAMASSAHLLVELAPLLQRFRVYAVDVIGQSPKSADTRPSVQGNDYGEWAAEVLDGLSLARAQVVGVSWGGFVSLRLAALAPERVAALALLVPAGVVTGPVWRGFWKIGLPMGMYLLWPSARRLERFTRHLLTTPDHEWGPYLGDSFLAYDMKQMRVPPLARPEDFAALRAPVMVIGADQDLSFPGEALLTRAKALFPTLTRTELLRGCRHCPPPTDEFRAHLGGILTDFFTTYAQHEDTEPITSK